MSGKYPIREASSNPYLKRRNKKDVQKNVEGDGGDNDGSNGSSGNTTSPKRPRRAVSKQKASAAAGAAAYIMGDPPSPPSSDDDDVEDEDFHISPRGGGSPIAESSNDSEGDQPEVPSGSPMPDAAGSSVDAQGRTINNEKLELSAPSRRRGTVATNYMKKGMTEVVRKLKLQDPRSQPKSATDYRFHTMFQQDFYETVIMSKNNPVAVSQWVDWQYMREKDNVVFNQIITECRNKHVDRMMSYKYDWNNEIIAQFYATCYFEEAENVRTVHWMTEGNWYFITYHEFARKFGYGPSDDRRDRIHIQPILPTSECAFMYHPDHRGSVGLVNGLYSYYACLNRLFRKSFCLREGDPQHISHYARNLLAVMKPGSRGFSVMDFVWEEIKIIASSPQKGCVYGPILMDVIETVTKTTFRKEMEHAPLRIAVPKKPILLPSAADEQAAAQSPPPPPPGAQQRQHSQRRAGAASSSQVYDKPPSPLRKFFNIMLGMCKNQHDIRVAQHHERQERKKNTRRLKRLEQQAFPDDPVSPPGSEEESSEIESFDQQMARFQQEDMYSVYMGGPSSSGVAGTSTSAPPPSQQSQDPSGFAAAATDAFFGGHDFSQSWGQWP